MTDATAEVSRGRILVIEDDPDCRNLFAAVLRSAGYMVLAAEKPVAPFAIRQLRLDALVLDLRQQGTPTGLELLTDVRATPGLGDLPVVVCSADEALLRDAM